MAISLLNKGKSTNIGNAIKDPRILPTSISYPARIYIKYGDSNSYTDTHSSFWTYLQDIGSAIAYEPEDNNTYKTIIDLTNVSGKIFNIITPCHINGGTGEIKVKLTIDGTEYILGPSVSTARRNRRFMIGGAYPFSPITSDTQTYSGQMGSYYEYGLAYYTAGNHPYQVTYQYIVDPIRYIMGGAPFLYFEESFKYEVLLNYVHTSLSYRNAGITYSLLY